MDCHYLPFLGSFASENLKYRLHRDNARFLWFPFGIVGWFADFAPKNTVPCLPMGVAFTAGERASPDISPILVQLFAEEMWRPTRWAVERQDLATHPPFPVQILCTIYIIGKVEVA